MIAPEPISLAPPPVQPVELPPLIEAAAPVIEIVIAPLVEVRGADNSLFGVEAP